MPSRFHAITRWRLDLDAVCGGTSDGDSLVMSDPPAADPLPEPAPEPVADVTPSYDSFGNTEGNAGYDPQLVQAAEGVRASEFEQPDVTAPVNPVETGGPGDQLVDATQHNPALVEPPLAAGVVAPVGAPVETGPILTGQSSMRDSHALVTPGQSTLPAAIPGAAPTEADMLRYRVDIAQNYEDGASPARLVQTNLNDCSIVSSLNQVARTPDGQAHLASRIQDLGDGFHQVRLTGEDGADRNVILRDPSPAMGSAGDRNLRIFEKALAVDRTADLGGLTEADVYKSIDYGAAPSAAMRELGLGNHWGNTPRDYMPADAVRIYNETGGALGGTAMTLNTNPVLTAPTTGDEIRGANHLRDQLSSYGLVDNHAYEVAMTYRDPTTNNNMVVLRNPHGVNHGTPIPEARLGELFSSFSVGRVAPR